MHVDVVETLDEFLALKQNWDTVYMADRRARYFLSHDFLSHWLTSLKGPWFVLAARPHGGREYGAFFPLRLRSVRRPTGYFVNEVLMAGNYGADYTGMLSRPDVDKVAVLAFAARLKQMHWSAINLDYVARDDARYRLFQAVFPRHRFRNDREDRLNLIDAVDNLVCPQVRLPASWDAYLEDLSANIRQKLRRLLRSLESDESLSISFPSAESFAEDIEDMCALWAAKWAPRKGARTKSLLSASRALLEGSFARGHLFMPILRQNNRMVAALAIFVDPQKRTAHFYMTGRDDQYDGPSPGLLLHAYSIRMLIEQKFVLYDFMRGNEPYKYFFANAVEELQCLRISTRTGRNIGDRLDPRSLPQVIEGATALHRKRKFRQAGVAYRQVLAFDPDNVHVLYRYAQLLENTGQPRLAGGVYRRLLEKAPNSAKVWNRLATCLETLGHETAALAARRRAQSTHMASMR